MNAMSAERDSVQKGGNEHTTPRNFGKNTLTASRHYKKSAASMAKAIFGSEPVLMNMRYPCRMILSLKKQSLFRILHSGADHMVCVFRSWDLKRNIWWNEVPSEKVAHYHYGRKILEERGWIFKAAVVDGRRGLAAVFKDIPVQVCHFHQLQTITRYLTRRPKTEAGQELRRLALTLTETTENIFTAQLLAFEKKWKRFMNEKTSILGTNRWYYTHKNVRGAFLSLKRNLPNLFTYQKYPAITIPNTTNTIDGCFASIKKKVGAHHGLRKDRRFKVISELLRKS